MDVDIIAKKTSFDPKIAAFTLGIPDSIFLWIFSSMTIESSITNPVHKTNANKVIRFSENPKKFKNIKVDKIEIGTVIIGINVLFKFLKNNNIIVVTKQIAKSNVKITSFNASETNKDVS